MILVLCKLAKVERKDKRWKRRNIGIVQKVGKNYPETPVSPFQLGVSKVLGGNLGFLMQPEFRIFKVCFSSEQCRSREKKDKVKIQET